MTSPIRIASDHAGIELKKEICAFLLSQNVEVNDLGPNTTDSVDYPDYAADVATTVQQDSDGRGILICGTGIGMSMAANKFDGIRAAVVHDMFTAQMSRAHNNSNILCLGARVLTPAAAKEIVRAWLTTKFEGGRHDRRVQKIHELET